MKKIPAPAFILPLFSILLPAFFPAGWAASRSTARAHLETARQSFMEEFARIDRELKKAAERLGAAGLTGGEARSALGDLFHAFACAVDCAAVDPQGRMVTVEPTPFRRFEGSDISGQEHVRRTLDLRRPVLSGTIETVEGIEATDAEHPIFGSEGAYLGSVSLLLRAEQLAAAALAPSSGQKVSSIWIMETGGRILFHPEKKRVGSNVFAGERLQADDNLRRLAERIAADPGGRDDALGTVWTSVSLYGTAWRLVVDEES